MAKKTEKAAETKDLFAPLKAKLKAQGFDYELPLSATVPEQACIVWARPKGNDTPRILLLLVASDQWDKVNANWVETRMFELLPTEIPEDQYPKFAYVSDGDAKVSVFDLEYPAHQIDVLPPPDEIVDYRQLKRDPLRRWSLKQYDRLMKGFNAFHEQVYQTVKDRVNGKNDIIEETAKTLFLESFRLQHNAAAKTFKHEGKSYQLDDVFSAIYLREHGAKAVALIHAAFETIKSHPDYVVTDDKGEQHPIFDKNTHLRLEQPRNYITLLELIQNLGPVTDNNGKVVKDQGTMLDISGDALGRAFDVFLRGNFESKGGFAIYLTPDPVKEAIMEMAYHDSSISVPVTSAAVLAVSRSSSWPITTAPWKTSPCLMRNASASSAPSASTAW
jgi:type I restriction enzyme M protein